MKQVHKNKFSWLAMLLIAMMVMPFAAFADNVQNDVVAGGSDTFTSGGSTVVNYRITANNGDGQTGCNAADTSPATVTINVPAGVSASPPSLNFSSCGTPQAVTFSSSTPGDYAITVSVTDAGTGTYNNSPASFTLHVQAPPLPTNSPPTITVPSSFSIEGNWVGGAKVTFSVTAIDTEDNPDPTPSCSKNSGDFFPLGLTRVNCSVTDSGGLLDTGFFDVTVVDTTAPVIASHADVTVEATSAAGAVVNYSSPATSDAVDGPGTAICMPASGSQFALGNTTITCTATDAAGNAATSTTFVAHVVDTTAPVIAAHADITVEATSAAGAVVNYSSPATSDAVDGPGTATCTPASGSQFAPGDTTITCTASDAAGNEATPTSFKIHVAYQLIGFYQPVDMNGVYNTVKNGATVPLKFEVFAGSTELTATSVVKSFVPTKIACDNGAVIDDVELTTTGGTSLRYDATAGQFVQNWQTPKTAGVCYRVTMTTQDASTLVAFFKLK